VPYLTPALEHLAVEDAGEPELRVRAFDSWSTGVRLPLTRDELVALHEGGMPAAQAVDGIHAAYQRPDSGLSFVDLAAGEAWYWSESARTTPFWDVAGPLRGILGWFLRSKGKQFVHAGAVANPDSGRAVLLVGPSGSGKSTTSVICHEAGMGFLADDYCAVCVGGGAGTMVYSLFATAKVNGDVLSRLPEASPRMLNRVAFTEGRDAKAALAVRSSYRRPVVESAPVGAIVAPFVGKAGESTRAARLSAAAALSVLAPSTMLQLASGTAVGLRDLAALVSAIPAYRLNVNQSERSLVDEILSISGPV